VPVLDPLVIPGARDVEADDRLETRAGSPLAEPPPPVVEKKKRWPIFTAVALAFLLLMGVGWFTATRDSGSTSKDDEKAATTTANPGPTLRTLNLPFDELGRTEEGRLGLRLPAKTLGGERFKDAAGVLVSVYPEGQTPKTGDLVFRAQFDPRSGKSETDVGKPDIVLTLDRLPEGAPDRVIDTLSVPFTKGQCVLIEIPYKGADLLPAEQGFSGKPPTSCTRITK